MIRAKRADDPDDKLKLASTSSFVAVLVLPELRAASFGAIVLLFAEIVTSATRIEVPEGKDPANARALSTAVSHWTEMDTCGGDPLPLREVVQFVLSNTTEAPLITLTLDKLTVIAGTVGLASAMAAMLTLSVMLPCKTTFRKVTEVQAESTTMSAVGSAMFQ